RPLPQLEPWHGGGRRGYVLVEEVVEPVHLPVQLLLHRDHLSLPPIVSAMRNIQGFPAWHLVRTHSQCPCRGDLHRKPIEAPSSLQRRALRHRKLLQLCACKLEKPLPCLRLEPLIDSLAALIISTFAVTLLGPPRPGGWPGFPPESAGR